MAIIGVDEVGRGCLAGPLLVCAVELLVPVAGLTDSKKLSKKRRQELAPKITASNPVGYGWVAADTIDDIGLSAALSLGAAIALSELEPADQPIIVDGNVQYYPWLQNSKTVIKADLSEPAVSAASIVAKVARDNYMEEINTQYPGYGFSQHVGYGTLVHRQAIKKLGLSKIHRQSFKLKLRKT